MSDIASREGEQCDVPRGCRRGSITPPPTASRIGDGLAFFAPLRGLKSKAAKDAALEIADPRRENLGSKMAPTSSAAARRL